MTNTRRIARIEAKKAVNRAIETKTYDRARIAGDPVDYSGTSAVYGLFDGITQSDTQNGVIGNVITPVGIRVNWRFETGDAINHVRIVLLQFKGASGSAPSVSGFLQSVGNSAAPLSLYDVDYNDQYKILYDKNYTMVSGDATQYIRGSIKIGAKKLRKIHVSTWSGATPPVLATYETNAIYLYAISDSAAAGHPLLYADMRAYFKDA